MRQPHKIFRSVLLFVLLNSIVINAFAISISTRRLYLDPNNTSTSIRVHNMDPMIQDCEVQIKGVSINSKGHIELIDNKESNTNSAKPLVRLAPRRFTITTAGHQMIKLLYRRKPGIESGEYLGVLAIKCIERKDRSNLPVTIIPALVHNIPVVVRTGKIPIQAEFVAPSIENNQLHIDFKIQGKRSITGDVSVMDATSGDVIVTRKHVSTYAQQPVHKLTLQLDEKSNGPLLVKFAENPEMGGKLVIQQLIE